MLPDLIITLIALSFVGFAVLDLQALAAHAGMVALGAIAFIALGAWAARMDYLKWPGTTTVVAGFAILVLVISGLASASAEWAFWLVFWSAAAAGVVSLWSVFYRGPTESISETDG